jgi:deoxyadenosine/deoxycytidine kinase
MSGKKKLIKILVEGSIGVGKSTLGDILMKLGYTFIKEPVDDWDRIGIMNKYYENKEKWAFAFQINVLSTKLKRFIDIGKKNHKNDVIFIERSGIGDKYVFFDSLYENKIISKLEWDIYNDLFNLMITKFNIFDGKVGLISIKSSIDECLKRIDGRGRSSEKKIDENYLKLIEKKSNEIPKIAQEKFGIENTLIIDNYNNRFINKTLVNNVVKKIEKFINEVIISGNV